MNPAEGESAPKRAAVSGRGKAFRPLIIFLTVGLPLLGWDFCRRQMTKTLLSAKVTLEGESLDAPLNVQIDGRSVSLKKPVPIGVRSIVISSRNTEPWSTNKFIWFGENRLGAVDLKRSRGDLRIAVKPAPTQVTLRGQLTNAVSRLAESEFKGLPVGVYQLELQFPFFRRTARVAVSRNSTQIFAETYPAGDLKLESDPEDSTFDLESTTGQTPRQKGALPVELRALPPGEYQLLVARGDYRQSRTVTVVAGVTNANRTVFSYGKLTINTAPTNAEVRLNYRSAGRTPLQMENLIPGRYNVEVSLDDYNGARWDLELKGDETVNLQTNLLSRRYTDAMWRATNGLRFGFVDYVEKLADLEEALKAKPRDSEALRQKPEFEFRSRLQQSQAALRERRLTNALAEVEAALGMRPGHEDAARLKVEVTKAIEEFRAQELEAKRQMEARLAEDNRRKAERAAQLKREEEARLAMETKRKAEAAKRAEENRIANKADASFKEVLVKLPAKRTQSKWATTSPPSEVEAALAKSISESPHGWRVKSTHRDEPIAQFMLDGAGLAEANQKAVVQIAPSGSGTEIRAAFYRVDIKLIGGITLQVGEQDNLATAANLFRQRLAKQLGKGIQ